MTYSEIVHLLSSHMVPIDGDSPHQTIPLLEKFVNMQNMNFQELDIEMRQNDDMLTYTNIDNDNNDYEEANNAQFYA